MTAEEFCKGSKRGRIMLKFVPKGNKPEPSIMRELDVEETYTVPSDQIPVAGNVVGKHWEASTSSESYDTLKKDFKSKCAEVDLLKSHLEVQNAKIVELQAEIESLQSKQGSLSPATFTHD